MEDRNVVPDAALIGEPANNEALANSMGLFCLLFSSMGGLGARIPPTNREKKQYTDVPRQGTEKS